jgi:hypothetical protein
MVSGSGNDSISYSAMDERQMAQFQNLWGGGNQLAGQQGPGSQYSQDMMSNQNNLFSQGQNMLGGLQNNPYMQGGYQQSDAATGQISALISLLDTQQGRMNQQAGQGAVQSGGFGGGRQGVAEGIIGEGAQAALSQGAGQIMGQDMQNQLGQAGLYAQSMMGGLNSLQGMFGLGGSGYQAQWAPLQNQFGLMGQNMIKSTSASKGDSFGYNAPSSG